MENKNNVYLSVIIPAYNEEIFIKNTLSQINNFLLTKDYNYEIIVIDDGSKDKTFSIVKDLQSKIKDLKIIQNDKNLGKGYSVKKGMLNACGNYKLFMDADNSTTIDHVDNFIKYANDGFDIIIGNRKLKKSNIKKRQSFHKEILGILGNYLIQIFAVPGVKDTQCGFKLFSSKSSSKIFEKLTIYRWGFDIEVLVIAKRRGFKIKSIPILWENREKTNVKLSDYIKTLEELLKIKINLLRKKYDN